MFMCFDQIHHSPFLYLQFLPHPPLRFPPSFMCFLFLRCWDLRLRSGACMCVARDSPRSMGSLVSYLLMLHQQTTILAFVNLTVIKMASSKQSGPAAQRAQKRRWGFRQLVPPWQLSILFCFLDEWEAFLNFSSPFHPGDVCLQYSSAVRVPKRRLSKVHGCPLKCTNVLLKKRNPNWELYVHAYSWNSAHIYISPTYG